MTGSEVTSLCDFGDSSNQIISDLWRETGRSPKQRSFIAVDPVLVVATQ